MVLTSVLDNLSIPFNATAVYPPAKYAEFMIDPDAWLLREEDNTFPIVVLASLILSLSIVLKFWTELNPPAKYAEFKIVELKEDGNDRDREKAKENEGAEILKVLAKNRGLTVLLFIEGKMYTTEEFTDLIVESSNRGVSTINFIIGGSYGVSADVERNADIKLSFSKFTFPHQLMRLIFLEQIYRWFSIINNSKYHKWGVL